jgi:hypothetical protein
MNAADSGASSERDAFKRAAAEAARRCRLEGSLAPGLIRHLSKSA